MKAFSISMQPVNPWAVTLHAHSIPNSSLEHVSQHRCYQCQVEAVRGDLWRIPEITMDPRKRAFLRSRVLPYEA
jgi:hypothetical protein